MNNSYMFVCMNVHILRTKSTGNSVSGVDHIIIPLSMICKNGIQDVKVKMVKRCEIYRDRASLLYHVPKYYIGTTS
jgi:hypothetical protein